MFGTPLIMIPRQVTRFAKSTGSPSTRNGMSPNTDRLKPVALTTMSASSTSPEETWTPFSVNSVDRVGDDRDLALAHPLEEVAVRHDRDAAAARAGSAA